MADMSTTLTATIGPGLGAMAATIKAPMPVTNDKGKTVGQAVAFENHNGDLRARIEITDAGVERDLQKGLGPLSLSSSAMDH